MGTLTLWRALAIVVEVSVLMALIYSIFNGVRYALADYGLEEKFFVFVKQVFVILGGIALVFFVAHLVTFYPRVVGHF